MKLLRLNKAQVLDTVAPEKALVHDTFALEQGAGS